MTLTQASLLTKRGLLFLVLANILGLSSYFGFRYYQAYKLSKLPPPEEKADNKFGSLPDLNFPPSKVSSANFSYSIDTTTGGFPMFSKVVRVYFLPQAVTTLLSTDKARDLAAKLGFSSQPQIASDTIYKFKNESGDLLTIDITSDNFKLEEGTVSASVSSKTANASGDISKLAADFKTFLSSKMLLPAELEAGPSKVDATEISLWPDKIDELPIVTPFYNKGLVRGNYRPNEQTFKPLSYTFWPVDKTTYATYKIKTTDEALKDLSSGRGYILLEPKKAKISLTNAYLAYYQSEDYSPYLQPIFVFEGPEFAAIVPAITK